MAINFPSSPSVSDQYVYAGVTYQWDGSHWIATTASSGLLFLANSSGIYPTSNTVGQELGDVDQRWVITANTIVLSGAATFAGGLANSTGLYPTSNTTGQLLGNTTARWDVFTTGQTTNSTGVYPVSNTTGDKLGNTISRFDASFGDLNITTGTALTPATPSTYPFYLDYGGNVITMGSDAGNAYIQTWNTKPLILNGQGNPVQVGASVVATLGVENQALTGGATVTEKDLGVVAAAGSLTLDMGDRPHQKYNANGAHTLAPGSTIGSCLLIITNGVSAGTMTTSGWTKVAGDAYTTTSGNKFVCHASVTVAGSLLIFQAMQ